MEHFASSNPPNEATIDKVGGGGLLEFSRFAIPIQRTLTAEGILMYRIPLIAIAFALTLLASQSKTLAQAGSITGVVGSVNGSSGTDFQPGDYIRGEAGATVTVAAGGQIPTGFTLSVQIQAPGGAFILSNSAAYEAITAVGQVKPMFDFTGATVPTEDYLNYYDFVATLTYFDATTFMNVALDSDWLVFSTD
ncbi:MAG: hypothetical protein L0211_19665 [Planctomycetaceae bacterium]|nr:hypothetical protein [Planctomycetaceae bacterium]